VTNKISAVLGSIAMGCAVWSVCLYVFLPIATLIGCWLYWREITRFVRHTVRFTVVSAVTFTLCGGDHQHNINNNPKETAAFALR